MQGNFEDDLDNYHLDNSVVIKSKWGQSTGQKVGFIPDQETKIKKVFFDPKNRIQSPGVADQYRDEYEIKVKIMPGLPLPDPFISWNQTCFFAPTMELIKQKRFEAPTPIQAQVFPAILAGYDVIGIAQTGSGKTIAYLIPGIIHITSQNNIQNGPIMLILAPTRELAMQIQNQVKEFASAYKLNSVCVYGGNQNKYQQSQLLYEPFQILVACPGRLLDFLREGKITLRNISYLVIDEADRMLDMGFETDVRNIIGRTRQDRQTVFFSATWPKAVRSLAEDFCQEKPVYFQIGQSNLTINKNISQSIICLFQDQKLQQLMDILDTLTIQDKVLIFAETKIWCEQLSQNLTAEGYYAIALHGDKTQVQRDEIMRTFKTSNTRLLCATDLASRGLDVSDITVVINYDFPKQFDDYIHRIGRTGRAERKGRSFSFLAYDRDDPRMAKELIKLFEATRIQYNQEDLDNFSKGMIPQRNQIRHGRNVGGQNLNRGYKSSQQFVVPELTQQQKELYYLNNQNDNNNQNYRDNGKHKQQHKFDDQGNRNQRYGQRNNNDRFNYDNKPRQFDQQRNKPIQEENFYKPPYQQQQQMNNNFDNRNQNSYGQQQDQNYNRQGFPENNYRNQERNQNFNQFNNNRPYNNRPQQDSDEKYRKDNQRQFPTREEDEQRQRNNANFQTQQQNYNRYDYRQNNNNRQQDQDSQNVYIQYRNNNNDRFDQFNNLERQNYNRNNDDRQNYNRNNNDRQNYNGNQDDRFKQNYYNNNDRQNQNRNLDDNKNQDDNQNQFRSFDNRQNYNKTFDDRQNYNRNFDDRNNNNNNQQGRQNQNRNFENQNYNNYNKPPDRNQNYQRTSNYGDYNDRNQRPYNDRQQQEYQKRDNYDNGFNRDYNNNNQQSSRGPNRNQFQRGNEGTLRDQQDIEDDSGQSSRGANRNNNERRSDQNYNQQEFNDDNTRSSNRNQFSRGDQNNKLDQDNEISNPFNQDTYQSRNNNDQDQINNQRSDQQFLLAQQNNDLKQGNQDTGEYNENNCHPDFDAYDRMIQQQNSSKMNEDNSQTNIKNSRKNSAEEQSNQNNNQSQINY